MGFWEDAFLIGLFYNVGQNSTSKKGQKNNRMIFIFIGIFFLLAIIGSIVYVVVKDKDKDNFTKENHEMVDRLYKTGRVFGNKVIDPPNLTGCNTCSKPSLTRPCDYEGN